LYEYLAVQSSNHCRYKDIVDLFWLIKCSLISSVHIKVDIRSATHQKWFAIAVLLLVLIISPVIVILVVNATNTIQAFASTLVQRTIELQREKHKGDTLLHQMLPRPVVRHLKQHRQANTD
jgi:Heme NO binding associated